ncbi:MAG: carboxylesterase family protein, partial [Thermoanaerobaculales bacterium]|nr:carboxylesterase family protein [Thermoanaerobaculales bacterium]
MKAFNWTRAEGFFKLTSLVARTSELFCVALTFISLGCGQPAPDLSIVTIDSGTISGTMDAGVRVFRGIPYAAPPVGDWRWKPPQPVEPWEGVRECTDFGCSCVHVPYPPDSMWTGPEWGDPAEQSEDCLHLNVWTTASSPQEKLPVMVWIHGGSLKHESGSVGAYGGANLARKGVVAVTINYRLGAFGYLAHPELTRESEHQSSGNYGVLDQIAALEWVQRNIAAFGGDPDRVTIFGESAGSWSVNFLVASPLARGLFHRAIGQSGAGFGPMVHLGEERSGLQSAEQTGVAFAELLGSADGPASLEAMRAAPATEILAKFDEVPGAYVGPVVGGWVFPDEIHTIFEQGRQNRVPVIVGSNADEGSMYAGPDAPATVEDFRLVAKKRYGDFADELLDAYPVTDDSDVRDTFVASVGDAIFTWEMRMWARMTGTVDADAWLYHFTRVPPIAQSDIYGSHHGAEIVYVIGNFHLASFTPEPEDERLAETMSGYWVNFAATGDPNGEGLPEWPAYNLEEEPYMEFGDTIGPG